MITTALIDMDGVLYDSMPNHTLAWHQMMREAGLDIPREEFFLYEGMTGRATIDLLFQRHLNRLSDPEEARRMYERKTGIFQSMPKVGVMPGAQRMIGNLQRNGVRCVLVTGSAQNSLISRLDEDYPGVFSPELRVTALDVVRGKPDPEPYLTGLRKAGATPGEAIVIENAPLGVRAGVNAGIRTIAVTTGPIPREEFEKEHPFEIYPSMNAFADDVELLIKSRLK